MRTKLTLFENILTVSGYVVQKSKIKFTITSVTWHFVRKVPVNKVLLPHLKPSFYDSTFDEIMALFLQSLMCVTAMIMLILRLRALIAFTGKVGFIFAEYVLELICRKYLNFVVRYMQTDGIFL